MFDGLAAVQTALGVLLPDAHPEGGVGGLAQVNDVAVLGFGVRGHDSPHQGSSSRFNSIGS